MTADMRWVVGADIGGTFTDIVLLGPRGAVHVEKRLSTVDDYSRAVVAGMLALLERTGVEGHQIGVVGHGTTVATNAILERRGAKTALLTTRGFRDVLEIGRLRTPRLYDMNWEKPRPLVPRRLRFEVTERLAADGTVVEPLDVAEVEAIARELQILGIESVAVCFLNAFLNGAHEQAAARVVQATLPGVALSLSSAVLPEIKEFERTSTTVTDAYVKPRMRQYLTALGAGLADADVRAPVFIMQSNGGVLDLQRTSERPVFAVESGPAAGVVAARWLAQTVGLGNVIAFDMGGTSAKASLIENGEISYASEFEVGGEFSAMSRLFKGSGYLIRTPVIDIAEVGAGGGSIASVDRVGSLRVGPRGAGANPGPVCYGLGGREATVTDANVVLGYISPSSIAGGGVRLDAAAARKVIETRVAAALGLEPLRAAYGVHQVANVNMARAIRAVSTERGRDVRQFAMVAFGGSGPVHAAALAREFEIPSVIVPRFPGLFSALGLLFADMEEHSVHTIRGSRVLLTDAALGEFEDLDRAVARDDRFDPREHGDRTVDRFIDLRYQGQGHELRVAVLAGEPAETVGKRFAEEHQRLFGHDKPGAPIEVVNLRLLVRHKSPWAAWAARFWQPQLEDVPAVPLEERGVYFGPDLGRLTARVYRGRGQLSPAPVKGPAVIDEYDATIVVPPGCAVRRDEVGNVRIEVEA